MTAVRRPALLPDLLVLLVLRLMMCRRGDGCLQHKACPTSCQWRGVAAESVVEELVERLLGLPDVNHGPSAAWSPPAT